MKSPISLPNKKILNIGHMGAGDLAPEHTLESIDKAIKSNVDIIEVDLRQTKDKVPVLCHDPILKRITGQNTYLKKISYSDLKKICKQTKTEIPSLNEFLDIVDNKKQIYLDIKEPKAIPNILRNLKQKKVKRGYLFCDDPKAVLYIKENAPAFKRGAIFHAFMPYKPIQQRVHSIIKSPLYASRFMALYRKINPYFLNAGAFYITPKFVNYWHNKGLKIFAWHNIKTKEKMKKLIDYGVDGLVTDRPDILDKIKNQN